MAFAAFCIEKRLLLYPDKLRTSVTQINACLGNTCFGCRDFSGFCDEHRRHADANERLGPRERHC